MIKFLLKTSFQHSFFYDLPTAKYTFVIFFISYILSLDTKHRFCLYFQNGCDIEEYV